MSKESNFKLELKIFESYPGTVPPLLKFPKGILFDGDVNLDSELNITHLESLEKGSFAVEYYYPLGNRQGYVLVNDDSVCFTRAGEILYEGDLRGKEIQNYVKDSGIEGQILLTALNNMVKIIGKKY